MQGFFYKVSSAMARFMYGRNGTDQLNWAILVVYLILWVLRTVVSLLQVPFAATVIDVVMLLLAIALLWRTFSRNLPKRRAENQKFVNWWWPIKSRFSAAKARRADKEHKYFTCKNCKTICRVPAGKGKIVITCPKCGHKIEGHS